MKLKKISVQIDRQQKVDGLINFLDKNKYVYDDKSMLTFITVIVDFNQLGVIITDILLYRCVTDISVTSL